MSITLGIDIALNNIGYAVLQSKQGQIVCLESGIITNKQTESFTKKLTNIHESLYIIAQKHAITKCGIEETFLNANPVSSLKLGAARGSAISAIGRIGVQVFDIKPNTVKKTVTGAGKAEKQQVAFMIRRLVLNVKDDISDDETDAIAIAFTAMNLVL